ncbi:MAG: ribosome biogenesis GTPase [Roseivirga sp.]|jgi:ribosome biogenesis GTPase
MEKLRGRVIKSTGSWYEVKTESGEVFQSRLRGKFKQQGMKINNPIAVGDWVMIEEEGEKGSAVIKDIEPRQNYIIRQSTRKSAFSHIIASNLDQAILVATLSFPRTSLGFIDRFLVSAESFRIPSILVLNKTDLMDEEAMDQALVLKALYESIGYPTFLISVLENEGLEEVRAYLRGKISLISGHSGVGKSSLLNALIPDLALKVGVVSKFANKGTHTTTFAQMFEMEADSAIIDTPGIKELGLVEMQQEEISDYLPEMRAFLGKCKFNNCLHVNEPHCAVLEAFVAGEISDSRYMSYISMLEDSDNRR